MLSLVFPNVRGSYSLLRSDLLRFLPIRKDAGRTAGFILLICLCLDLIILLVFLTLTEHLFALTTSN